MVNSVLTALLLAGVVAILIGSAMRWVSLLKSRRAETQAAATA